MSSGMKRSDAEAEAQAPEIDALVGRVELLAINPDSTASESSSCPML